jgi:hypothetical protein
LEAHSRNSLRRQRGAHGNHRMATLHDSIDPSTEACDLNARRLRRSCPLDAIRSWCPVWNLRAPRYRHHVTDGAHR